MKTGKNQSSNKQRFKLLERLIRDLKLQESKVQHYHCPWQRQAWSNLKNYCQKTQILVSLQRSYYSQTKLVYSPCSAFKSIRSNSTCLIQMESKYSVLRYNVYRLKSNQHAHAPWYNHICTFNLILRICLVAFGCKRWM